MEVQEFGEDYKFTKAQLKEIHGYPINPYTGKILIYQKYKELCNIIKSKEDKENYEITIDNLKDDIGEETILKKSKYSDMSDLNNQSEITEELEKYQEKYKKKLDIEDMSDYFMEYTNIQQDRIDKFKKYLSTRIPISYNARKLISRIVDDKEDKVYMEPNLFFELVRVRKNQEYEVYRRLDFCLNNLDQFQKFLSAQKKSGKNFTNKLIKPCIAYLSSKEVESYRAVVSVLCRYKVKYTNLLIDLSLPNDIFNSELDRSVILLPDSYNIEIVSMDKNSEKLYNFMKKFNNTFKVSSMKNNLSSIGNLIITCSNSIITFSYIGNFDLRLTIKIMELKVIFSYKEEDNLDDEMTLSLKDDALSLKRDESDVFSNGWVFSNEDDLLSFLKDNLPFVSDPKVE